LRIVKDPNMPGGTRQRIPCLFQCLFLAFQVPP
jgi:hypothetical protein